MKIEVIVPGDWTPGLTVAMQPLMQQAVRSGWPLITGPRPEATADQIEEIHHQITELVQARGLAA